MKRTLVVLCKIAFVLFAVVFLIVLLVDRNIEYYLSDKNVPLLPNSALAVAVLGLGAGGALLRKRADKATTEKSAKKSAKKCGTSWVERHYMKLCIALPLLVLLLHMGMYVAVHMVTRWDAATLRTAAMTPVGEWTSKQLSYYGRYPNNLFLLGILHALYAALAGVVGSLSGHTIFAFCSTLLVSASCFFFMRAAETIVGTRKSAFVASLLYLLLVGMSPWAFIPYSDTFGLFFCTTLLWCFACSQNVVTKWLMPSFLAVIGYAVKPTVIFAFVAWLVARVLADGSALKRIRQTGIIAAYIAAGMVLGFVCVRGTTVSLAMELDPDAQVTLSHYVMMGLNDKRDGCFYSPDVDFSCSQPNVAAREEANWRVAQERLQAYGPGGLAQHLLKKLLLNYNDGTFAWGREGHFFDDVYVTNLPAASLVTSYYLDSGSSYAVFCTVQQALWLVTLAGIPFGFLGIGALADEKGGRRLALVATMLASLVALTVFLLVFEARARYLYLYGGFFVMLAAWGYQQLWHKVGART